MNICHDDVKVFIPRSALTTSSSLPLLSSSFLSVAPQLTRMEYRAPLPPVFRAKSFVVKKGGPTTSEGSTGAREGGDTKH